MKITYILGIDLAKHKVRAALRAALAEHFLFEKDLPVQAAGLRALLTELKARVPEPEQLLVLVEATGVLHLNWSAALTKAGYKVVVLNPLMAHRLCTLENSIRQNKTDPLDARGLCAIGALHGEKLWRKYGFALEAERLGLQRLQSVRQALRRSLTNLKKTYQSLLDLSFPELGQLMELDGVGLRELLAQAPTPAAIAQKRLSTLQKDWRVRGKAQEIKTLAAHSMADPELAQASAPALQAILHSLALVEAQLREVDQQIDSMVSQQHSQTKALLQTIPGFGPTTAAKALAYLPAELVQRGSNR
jgi:transposase